MTSNQVWTNPDGERSVFAADSTAAVRAAGLWRAAVLLLLLKDFWVEFLQKKTAIAYICGQGRDDVHVLRVSVCLKVAYHHGDSFAVAHKVHVGLPAVSLHDLSSGTRVVHGVSRHQVLTIRRPGQTQDVGCPATLRHKTKQQKCTQAINGESVLDIQIRKIETSTWIKLNA